MPWMIHSQGMGKSENVCFVCQMQRWNLSQRLVQCKASSILNSLPKISRFASFLAYNSKLLKSCWCKIFDKFHMWWNVVNKCWKNFQLILECWSNCRRHAEEVLAGSGVRRDGHLTSKSEIVFFSDIFAKSRKYFCLILKSSSNCRTRSGGAAQDSVWREGWRVGGTPDLKKEWKCFFLRYHVNIFTLF